MASPPSPAHGSVGMPHTPVNRPAPFVHVWRLFEAVNLEDYNASVWVKNLPGGISHATLLNSVRDCGKVFAIYINPPRDGYVTVSGTIIFFDVAGARNLLQRSREGRFVVEGYVAQVGHNRIRTPAQPPSSASRVLLFEGPSHIVNPQSLSALFNCFGILWQDEAVIVWSRDGTFTQLEWRFASYFRQAQAVWDCMDQMFRDPQVPRGPWTEITVRFGADPCDISLPSRRY
ncbi:hypothetical protein F5Y07DRAFT_380737 [Xylaria sp. FL0933]|nr:hypothetical protein F5Y07DRAFT_380737 [Xylaria sp. FL0933]